MSCRELGWVAHIQDLSAGIPSCQHLGKRERLQQVFAGQFEIALADLVDRKALLLLSQVWMLLMAGLLGVLTLFGYASPWVLLALTFGLGLGGAISLPAWQATVQALQPVQVLRSIAIPHCWPRYSLSA